MAMPNSNHALLLPSILQTPIAQLSPSLESTESRSIEAIVTLTWPYSSASNSITFLFSEPDFRLRNSRGQVRVEFSGPSGISVVKAGVSSGDRVNLSLEGVEWIQDDTSPSIPGRGIEFKLRFTDKIFLQFQQEGSKDLQEINVNPSLVKEISLDPKNTVASEPECLSGNSNNLDQLVSGKINYSNHLYSSPAFLKRARTSYGSLFDSELDTFIEADGSIQGKGRKKSRLSLTWGYRSPSPDLEEKESKEDVPMQAAENNLKPVKSVMVDEGVQTNEDSSIEILGQLITEQVVNSKNLSIPIITQNLTREKLAIKGHHVSKVDENEIKNNQLSDLMPTGDTHAEFLTSPQKSSILSENHIQKPLLPLIGQSSISGKFGLANTQPIVRESRFNPVICADEVENHLNDSDSNELDQVKDGIQNLSTNVTLSRQETCRSYSRFEEKDAPDYISLNPSSDRIMTGPQPNSSLKGNFISEPRDGEKSTVENIDNEHIQFFDASPDQDLIKNVELPVQDFNPSKMTHCDQVQSSSAVKSGSEYQPNIVGVPPSPSSVAILRSDGGCLIEGLNLIKDDDNSIPVDTDRSLNINDIPLVSSDETEIISTGTSEDYVNSSLYEGSENETHEEQGDTYQSLTDSESHGYHENYNSQYDEEMISEEDNRFSNMLEDPREDNEDSLRECEIYHDNKEVPMYIDLVSSDDENESSISAIIPVGPELKLIQSEMITNNFDENDEEEEKGKEAEEIQIELEGEGKPKTEEEEEREEQEIEETEKLEVKFIEENREIEEVIEEMKGVEEIKEADVVEVIEENREIEEEEEVEEMNRVKEMGEKKDRQQAKEKDDEKVLIPPDKHLDTDERPYKSGSCIISIEKRQNSEETEVQQVDSPNTKFVHKETSSKIPSKPLADISEGSCTEDEITHKELSVIGDILRTDVSQEILSREDSPINNSSTHFGKKKSYQPRARSLSERNSPGSFVEKSLPKAENEVNDSKRILKSMKLRTSSKLPEPNSSFQTGVNNSQHRGLGHDASFEIALSSLDSPSKRRSPPIVDSRIRFSRKLRTELSEYTPLKLLRQHLNEKLDVLAIVTSTPAPPKRVKGGPRDYLLTFNVIDPSIAPISVTGIQIFRPFQEALPVVEIGDGIILRNFQVVMDKNIYSLKSKMKEGSSWAVVKSNEEIQVRGPPIEYNMTEIDYVSNLQTWFSELDTVTRSKLIKANGKVVENKK
ncbi:putative 3-dehydroshikimate dehydratase [Erysiphe neolycopersici]|uniref:Putative 3-dehydroshikimate dehydratase n=1 Tax=Erysiphe neolycopersici TaxID=212602 RepID=A0A420I2K9_9PEZI|nr:putative 3-dehydroshikimate dehydratase [Erysiphe neolycopersici]